MTGYDCPVEGCDYTADQIDQIRGHVNASADHPSWRDLDAGSELVDQNDQQETTPSEGGKSPDEDGDDDQPDDPPEGDDKGGGDPSDAGSEDDDQPNDQNDQQDTPMPTDDGLQRQRRVQGAQPDESGSDDETSQETSKTTPSKGGNEGGSAAGLLRAIDTSTIIMLVAALAVALILYRLLSGDRGDAGSEQDVKLPQPIKLLATTGRGKVPSIWITQRLQEIDEAILSQNNANLLGGFGSDRDRGKLDVEYPVKVHNPEADRVPNLPAELHHPEDGAVPLQKTEEDGVGRSSEWIYPNDDGKMERLNSASIDMTAEHYGGSDQKLRHPFDP